MSVDADDYICYMSSIKFAAMFIEIALHLLMIPVFVICQSRLPFPQGEVTPQLEADDDTRPGTWYHKQGAGFNMTFAERPPSRYIGLVGETRSFACVSAITDPDVRIVWDVPSHLRAVKLHDDTPITLKSDLTATLRSTSVERTVEVRSDFNKIASDEQNVFVTTNNTLILWNMSVRHHGVFKCRLLNDHVTVVASMHVLVVDADQKTLTFRLIIGAVFLAGVLVLYALVYLGHKVYVCKKTFSMNHGSDFDVGTPLKHI